MSVDSSPSVLSLIQTALPSELGLARAAFDLEELQHSPVSLRELPHWLALENWLYHCRATLPHATCLADVTGLIEASYHSCALGQWAMAYQLICWPVGKSALPLYQQLAHWGYYRQQIALCQTLRGKLSPTVDLQILNELGQAHRYLGELAMAQDCHRAQLELAHTVGEQSQEMGALMGLGCVFDAQGSLKLARSHFQECYELAVACQNASYQVRALVNLQGIFAHSLASSSPALLEQALAIAQRADNPTLEIRALSGLAFHYFFVRGNYDQTWRYLQILFSDKYRTLFSRHDEVSNLRLMGFIQISRQPEQALTTLTRALSIARESSLAFIEATILNDLCIFFSLYRKDPAKGIPYGEQALKIAQRLGNPYADIRFNANLAIFHAEKGDTDQAEAYLKVATANYRATHQELNRAERAHLLACIARVRWLRGQYLWALWTIGHSFVLQPPWSSANGRLILQGTIDVVIVQPLKKLAERLK